MTNPFRRNRATITRCDCPADCWLADRAGADCTNCPVCAKGS